MIHTNTIRLGAEFKTKEEAIRATGELLVAAGAVEESYIQSMLEREETVSTYMGNFIAIPHGTDASKGTIKKTMISIVVVPEGIDFSDIPDEKKVFVLFGIAGIGDEHLDLLSKIAIFCSEMSNVEQLILAETPEAVIALLENIED